jgi:23S rRNA pseudouridine2605 synthase
MARKIAAPPTHSGERIAKVMARAGLCSRREAEAWIASGRVAVNGQTISSPALNVSPHDAVLVDGKPLPLRERTRLFRYHKPRGLLTTSRDPQGRPTFYEKLPPGLPRLVSVGRLDFNSEGLLLLTNDGGLKRALELPETGWLRRYRVRANGKVSQEQLDGLKRGVNVDGVAYGPVEAKLDRVQGANVWLTVGLREGKNREVRNVLRSLDLHVNRLIRVSYGPFQLSELAPGAVEEVKTRTLQDQLGRRLAVEASVDFVAPLREAEPGPSQAKRGTRERARGSRHGPPRPRTTRR